MMQGALSPGLRRLRFRQAFSSLRMGTLRHSRHKKLHAVNAALAYSAALAFSGAKC
jgi:hypothetical protein